MKPVCAATKRSAPSETIVMTTRIRADAVAADLPGPEQGLAARRSRSSRHGAGMDQQVTEEDAAGGEASDRAM